MVFRRPNGLSLLAAATAILLVPIVPAAAQQPVADSATPAPIHWSQHAVRALIGVIAESRREGLSPADYDPAALQRAVAEGKGPALDALATASALQLAHDYYLGRMTDRSDMQWLIERSPYEAVQLPARLQSAVEDGTLRAFFQALLPSDPRYAALRDALAEAAPGPMRDTLRVNMERWRWMPRSIAENYLYVNVPSYRLRVFQDGVQLSAYDVVVGAKGTPTPQMVTPTGSLVVNPAWYVPASIVRKSGLRAGRGGFVGRRNADGSWTVVQPPGPHNALGRIKFNLDNDQAIYMHDTNAKSAFNRDDRALSHGCVRVKDIDQLATELMEQGGDEIALEEALAGKDTETLHLPQTWPVYIVYFTADTDAAGDIVTYDDPYDYDSKVLAALDGEPVEIASN
jgi:murein L,D-transpeptidase YcbB/YkuD